MTGDAPIVDVCLPTLGRSPYVRESLESILAQTLQSWRLVISENGDGDSDMERLLSEYSADARINHLVVGTLVSQAANWTNAIRDGTAPFVAMLHDDDRWDPEFLSRRIAFLNEEPDCGFVFGGYRIVSERGELIRRVTHDIPTGRNASRDILPILFKDCLVAPPTAVVRRAAYEAVGNEFMEILYTDHEMWIRLAAQHDVGYLDICDSDYRLHPNQMTEHVRTRVGAAQLELIASTEGVRVPRTTRAQARADAHLLAAIDAAEAGQRGEALREVRDALRTRPALVVSAGAVVRIGAVLTTAVLGKRAVRTFRALRIRRFRRRHGG